MCGRNGIFLDFAIEMQARAYCASRKDLLALEDLIVSYNGHPFRVLEPKKSDLVLLTIAVPSRQFEALRCALAQAGCSTLSPIEDREIVSANKNNIIDLEFERKRRENSF